MAEGLVIKNKLRIVRRVGRGGMGHVYEVYHEVLRVRRALKQIVSDLQDNPEIERRFLHEAQMMARLEHPHIVKVFDVDHEPGFGTYLLMEFIQGRDLGSLLRERNRFTYEETVRIGLAVASALDCAHAAGLVHRDIKPANILLEEASGRPVVTDFGIAKEVEGAGEEGFTKTGSFVGTYRYSSREQIRAEKGVPIDGRADVYSLGVVLYEMSTGHRYLEGMAELKIASCVGYQDDWRPPLTFPDDLPEEFRKLIERSIEPNRDERVESARALMGGLEECLGMSAPRLWTPASPPPRGQAPPPLAATATGAGAALQEVADAATELDDSDTGITEQRARERARLVVRLQGLRKSVDGQSVEFERLLKTLQGFDLPRDEFRQLDDMSQILHRVEESEREGEIDAAIASLEGLSDRLQRNSSRMEASLVAAIERSRDELQGRWRRLGALGPPWIERDRAESVERSLAGLAGALAGHRWDECQLALEDASGRIEEGWRIARERAGRHIETGLAALADRLTALREASREDADRTGIDPETLAGEVTSALETGDLSGATSAVDAAVAALERALAEVARRDAAAADEARSRCEADFAEIPRASAERLAREDLASADGRRAAAEAARSAGDLRTARAAYAEASALALALRESVGEALAAERDRAATALRELLEEAQDAPAEVVGNARSTAQAALAGPAVADEPNIAKLQQARAALAAALAEAEQFGAARSAETRASEVLARVRALSPTAPELAPGERQIAAARAALSKRDWALAANRFAEAAATLDALAGEISERRERDDVESARSAAESLLAALPRERAAAVAKRDLGAGEKLLAEASAANKAGDRVRAKAAFGSAAEALAKVRDAVAADLVRATTELAREWESVRRGLGDLLDARALGAVEGAIAEARQAADGLRLGAAEAALRQAEAALPELRGRAQSRARERIDAGLAALDAAWADLARVQPSRAPAEDDRGAAVGRRADALVAEGRVAEAVALVETAATAAGKTATDEAARLQAECAEARGRVARLREGLTGRQVRAEDAAAEDLRDADAREKAARERQDAGALAPALEGWREAERALARAGEKVREGESALVAEAVAGLEGLLESARGASEEIAGTARAAARTALGRAASADAGGVAPALAALSEARRQLEAAVAEAAENDRAVRARSSAAAARERATARGPKRRQLKAGEKLERDAVKAFQRRRWEEAARGYEGAAEAFAALDAELAASAAKAEVSEDATRVATPTAAKPRVAAFAGAGVAAVLLVGALLWWRASPGPAPEVPQKRTAVADRADTKTAQKGTEPKQIARVEPRKDERPEDRKEAPVGDRTGPDAKTAVKPDEPKKDTVATDTVAPKDEVARVEPAPTAAPPKPRIASFEPASPAVKVAEGGRETFRIALADVAAGATPKVEWRLGDEVVARDVPEFTWSPDFDAAQRAKGAPLPLVATVGGAAGPSQRWEIDVTDVNRAPALDGTTPATGAPIQAEAGTKVALAAKVSDPDRDEIRYSWKVDGKALPGDGAKVEVPVSGDANVEVTATDGDKSVKAQWRIAAIKPPFRVETKPTSLTRLAFASPQEFRADLPRGLAASDVDLEWTVDGRKAGTGSTFRFANDDPARIRKEPVKVGLRAKDASGRSFSRDWSFVVSPPAPKLSGATPRPGDVPIDRGGEQVFALDVAKPVGAQALEYVFEVDGRRVGGSDPRFAYSQKDDRPHTVVAYVRDNFDQLSAKQRWNVRPSAPAADIVGRARAWLSQYQDAFNRKDARKIGELRGLGADAVAKLQQALDDQQGLRVDFSNVRVERLDDGRARVTYDRTDRFTEARDGRPVERTGSVEQVVGVVGGQLKELETRRR